MAEYRDYHLTMTELDDYKDSPKLKRKDKKKFKKISKQLSKASKKTIKQLRREKNGNKKS